MITAPFPYWGGKRLFYKFIRSEFLKSGRKNYVDPFGGSCVAPVNLKAEFPDRGYFVQYLDGALRDLMALEPKRLEELYRGLAVKIFGNDEVSAREVYENKERWEACKKRAYGLMGRLTCSCCGQTIKGKAIPQLSKDEMTVSKLFQCGGWQSKNDNNSLANSCYSPQKAERLADYFTRLRDLAPTFEAFDETRVWEEAFILIDPPYVQSTDAEGGGIKGTKYGAQATEGYKWGAVENLKLVEYIKANVANGNTLMVFGAKDNHLQKELIRQSVATEADFLYTTTRKSILGKSRERTEWVLIL